MRERDLGYREPAFLLLTGWPWGSPALSGLSVATCTTRAQGKWLLESFLVSFDKSKKGTKFVACWETEREKAFLRREARKGRKCWEWAGLRVSSPQEGVKVVLRPLLTNWSLGGHEPRSGLAQKVLDSPFAHPGRNLVENSL